MSPVKTPCIGICSTTSFGDSVCRGCKRYLFEVIDWNAYDPFEKEAVLRRLEKLEIQILDSKLHIVDEELLIEGMRKLGLGYDSSLSPFCWVHNLLAKCHQQIPSLAHVGLRAQPEFAGLTVSALAKLMDEELLTLSAAHSDRYIGVQYNVGQ
ncbi:MAG: DUF1289 domain-containing protein [Pseudohongiellaceae bacterium]